MRMVSKVNASTCTSANAFFTIMAFVEKSIAPIKAVRNPARLIECLVLVPIIIVAGRRSTANSHRTTCSHTATLKSLNASFKLVLRSVLGFRLPMIKAQLTLYSPAGNFFG